MCQGCINLIEHDLRTLELLNESARSKKPPEDVTDWKCTLLFYMACIYVKALGHQRNKALPRHSVAREWLNSDSDLIPIAKPYRKLEDRSQDARYEGRKFSPAELAEALRWFIEVRNVLVPLLRAAGLPNTPLVNPQPFL